MRIIVSAVAALSASAALAASGTPEVKIVDIKAYVFLEHADKLSDDLVGTEDSSTCRAGARRAAIPRQGC